MPAAFCACFMSAGSAQDEFSLRDKELIGYS